MPQTLLLIILLLTRTHFRITNVARTQVQDLLDQIDVFLIGLKDIDIALKTQHSHDVVCPSSLNGLRFVPSSKEFPKCKTCNGPMELIPMRWNYCNWCNKDDTKYRCNTCDCDICADCTYSLYSKHVSHILTQRSNHRLEGKQ
mgnify:CR=1 FL=1